MAACAVYNQPHQLRIKKLRRRFAGKIWGMGGWVGGGGHGLVLGKIPSHAFVTHFHSYNAVSQSVASGLVSEG